MPRDRDLASHAWEPLTWWVHTWRLLVAAAAGVVLLGSVLDPAVAQPVASGTYALDAVLGVVSLVLLPWHRRFPVVVPLVLQAMTAVSVMSTGAASVAPVSVGTRRRWRLIVAAALTALGAYVVGTRTYPPAGDSPPPVVDAITVVALLGVQIGWGMYIGARRDLLATLRWRAELADEEQARRVAQAQGQERERIAREMHDVLAHRISLISMHAGALAYRDDLTPEEVRGEAALIQQASSEALGELRGILGVLRSTDVDASTAPPQPTFADAMTLVDAARAAGLAVTVHRELPEGATVPGQVGRHAYRILQETLTNVRKHAPGAHTRVTTSGRPGGSLHLEVVNSPAASGGSGMALPGSGLGLVGLAERVAIVGGALEHGPTPDGGYRVVADLPWPEES